MHLVTRCPGRRSAGVLLTLLLGTAVGLPVHADEPVPKSPLATEAYLTPAKEIADAVLATRDEVHTLSNISPDGKKFVIVKNDGMPPLSRVGRPTARLGEVAFDHTAGRSRDLWIRSVAGYDIFYHTDKRTVPVQIPDQARVSTPIWSPDGTRLGFFAHFDTATYIYIADADTGFSRRLSAAPILATMVNSFQWSKDGKKIQTVLRPNDGASELPKPNAVATEPKVRVTRGGNNPTRTYRFLLESPYDMKLLESLVTGQVALIDVNDGKITKIGFPNLIRSVSMSPNEENFRVTTMKKPFSYYVPLARFGSQEGVWNLEGKSLYTLNDRNLQDTEPQRAAVAAGAGAGQRAGRGGRGGRGQGQGQGQGQQPTPAPNPAPGPTQPPTDPIPDPNADPTAPAAPPVDPNAKREITWRPDGVGLSYLQLEPPKADATAARKDRVMQWLPPFGKDDVKLVYETPNRIASLQYSENGKMLFLTQTVDGQQQISAIDLADPKTIKVINRSAGRGGNAPARPGAATPATPIGTEPLDSDDADNNAIEQQRGGRGGRGGAGGPGGQPTLMLKSNRGQVQVVRLSTAGDVYLSGSDRPDAGAAAAAPAPAAGTTTLAKPYIDKVSIKTGKKERIFEGKGQTLETIEAVDGDDIKLVFTTRQKKDQVPNSYVTELQGGKVTKLTNNVDPAPWASKLKVERIQVTRVDGIKFWVKVTTPPKSTGKLPALFWIYPREYADQAAYNTATARTNADNDRFAAPGPRSMSILTLAGYALVEPDVPIIGPAGRMNDNYVPDLRNSLWAVIDELDKRGIIDRDRLACGGHSYGAFSTANAMAHTPFFKAGIAGDGNYNRTLTTMTFQSERRQIWDARETYLEMSPLLWANRVNGALLMYHGMEDENVGTNPMNADHMFMALDGLGKPAALYMYPYEGHGPIAKETTLDMWARWTAWLDMYVKNPKQPKKPTTPPGPAPGTVAGDEG
jgi:dipeptidyl aminopeptidase/acylaminoacyl peptidase